MRYMRTLFRWWTSFSPRRRILLGGAGLLAATVGIVAGVRVLARRAGTGGRPARARCCSFPGYGGSTGRWTSWPRGSGCTGRTAMVVPLAGNGTGDLTVQARVLDGYVNRAIGAGSGPVTVIGYSAGGVVAWLWDVDYGGAGRAGTIITLGSPLHGARIAAVGAAFDPGECPVACQQLAPGSALLTQLQQSGAGATAVAVAVEHRRPDGAAAGLGAAGGRGERAAAVGLPGRGHPAQPAADRARLSSASCCARWPAAASPPRHPAVARRLRLSAAASNRQRAWRSRTRSLCPSWRSSPRPHRGRRPRTPAGWRTRAGCRARRSAAGRSRSTPASTASAGRAARALAAFSVTSISLPISVASAPSAAPRAESVRVDRKIAIAATPSIETVMNAMAPRTRSISCEGGQRRSGQRRDRRARLEPGGGRTARARRDPAGALAAARSPPPRRGTARGSARRWHRR